MSEQLSVGDRMRFSIELLKQIADGPDAPRTVLVEVVEIRDDADGCKTVVLKNVGVGA